VGASCWPAPSPSPHAPQLLVRLPSSLAGGAHLALGGAHDKVGRHELAQVTGHQLLGQRAKGQAGHRPSGQVLEPGHQPQQGVVEVHVAVGAACAAWHRRGGGSRPRAALRPAPNANKLGRRQTSGRPSYLAGRLAQGASLMRPCHLLGLSVLPV
jgi:hypothetical protein